MEPAAKAATNKVPVVFQQYPKIQQLYPLYPVYPGVRGVNQHATRAKGLDLLQDEQFDTRNLQLTDKGTYSVDRDAFRNSLLFIFVRLTDFFFYFLR